MARRRAQPYVSLEHARNQASELLAGVQSGETRAIDKVRWSLPRMRALSDREIQQEPFSPLDAQQVVARHHHFEDWNALAEFIRAVEAGDPDVLRFEHAADALIDGDLYALRERLLQDPALISQRSTRAHRSTLLHYVSANGVEDFRQVTPANIVAICRLLLDAGADVAATSEAYGGGSTVLGLVSTSAHPRARGVQIALIDMLLAAGARIDDPDDLPNLVSGALANGCPEAAVALASRGTYVNTLYAAAGAGNLVRVQAFLADASIVRREQALSVAAMQGHGAVVRWLLDQGVDVAANDGMTALHHAAGGGHLDVVDLLLDRGAPLEARNAYGGTVLASTMWYVQHLLPADAATRALGHVIQRLVGAGARTDVYPELQQELAQIVPFGPS